MGRTDELSRVTLLGALANILLTLVKIIAGFVGGSAAMIADAIHSLSDLVSDAVVFVMLRISGRGKDKNHDYGHGKFETLATLAIAVLLLVVGARLLSEGVATIRSVISGEDLEAPGAIAFWAAIISIAIKEALYRWTVYVGEKHCSPAVKANAWHHRTDALSSVASALGIGFAILLGGKWVVLDPVVCCGISIFIFYIAVKMSVPAIEELTESSLPDEVEEQIKCIMESVDGVENVHAIKTRKSGPSIIIDAHVVVDPQMSVLNAHAIMDKVENALRTQFGETTQISLHVEPSVESA